MLPDTGNRAYTDHAFRAFASELQRGVRWRIVRCELDVGSFDANRQRELLEGDFDALYVLAGSILPMIGNISQLFHLLHPSAPILLTPSAYSPQVAASAGPAAGRILQVSPYPARRQDGRVDTLLVRFEQGTAVPPP